jgi:hypothetical protein
VADAHDSTGVGVPQGNCGGLRYLGLGFGKRLEG